MERGFKAGLCALATLVSIATISGQDPKYQNQISEATEHKCASGIIHERLMSEDAEYRRIHEANEEVLRRSMEDGIVAQRMVTYTIPVVVHVIHTGEPEGTGTNISDVQIQSAITALNEDYRRMPGTNGYGSGPDTEIEFCLASRDPSGNPTNGIVRANGSTVSLYAQEGISVGQGSGANELSIKDLSRWPRDDYYNIWIVNEIEDNDGGAGIQGYAYFPGGSVSRDGAVILYNAFGTTGVLKSYTSLNRTATHELGHGFNLYHTFDGGSCSESNCSTQGDRVCDTPPTVNNPSCGSPACGGTQQVENYMDYTPEDCMNMFTVGQKTRMRSAITSLRSSLLNSLGCTPPNALDAGISSIIEPIGFSCSTSLAPVVELKNFGSNTLTSVQIKYQLDGGSIETYNYSGSLASGASQSITLPSISTIAGAHNLEVYTQSPNGSSDGYSANDAAEADFEIVSGSTVTVSITVDDYGNETTWDIKDSNGNVVINGGPYAANASGTTYESSFCLAEECYDFTIYDSYGDGICCGWGFGSYEVSDSDGNILAQSGADFTDFETTEICIGTSTAPPSADFSAANSTTCLGSTIQFNDQSTGDITSRLWTFEGGTPSTSYQTNPVVLYSSVGQFDVTLQVTGPNGSDTEAKTDHIVIGNGPTITGNTADQTCWNSNDGAININVSGGTQPYSYDWDEDGVGDNDDPQDIQGLGAGVHTVIVTDASGCSGVMSFNLNAPVQLTCVTSTTGATCTEGGTASVTVAGGTSPYTYLWSNSMTTATIYDLSAGEYLIVVTDANGCQSSGEVMVDGIGTIDLSNGSKTNVSCSGGADGSASVDPTGGESPYSYSWSNGASTQTVTGLSAGTYTVTVIDDQGCVSLRDFNINEPTQLTLSATTVDIGCNGSTGSIEASIQGGTPPYTYHWNGAGFGQTLNPTSVQAGDYTLSVTDNNGCQATLVITVSESPGLSVTLTGTNENCRLSDDGTLQAELIGGTPPISFGWNGAGFGQTLNPQGVVAGTYTFTASDANGCQSSATFTITQPPGINLSNNSSTPSSCNNDGTASIAPTGGVPGYSYLWSDPDMQTTSTATGLAGGNYLVFVTDASGCQKSKSITVASTSDLNLNQGNKQDPSCFGGSNGTATVSAQGGTPGYNYQWNDMLGQLTPTANGLTAGMYVVTVTDASGCQAIRTFMLEDPEMIQALLLSMTPDSCGLGVGDAHISTSGGTGAHFIVWDDDNQQTGAELIDVRHGTYAALISDENLCEKTELVIIEEVECTGTTSLIENDKLDFRVLPNPVSGGEFEIRFSDFHEDDLQISLIDITGRIISLDPLRQARRIHSIVVPSSAMSGVYMVHISDGIIHRTERIILIR